MSRLRFWGSALAVALLFALLSAALLPYSRLGLDTEALRWRAWLLTVWTAGVLSVLFGLSGLLGYRLPPGVREVLDAGSLRAVFEARRRAAQAGERGNFAVWLIATGGMLVAIYFAAFTVLGRGG